LIVLEQPALEFQLQLADGEAACVPLALLIALRLSQLSPQLGFS
jgi:hypothetical protein